MATAIDKTLSDLIESRVREVVDQRVRALLVDTIIVEPQRRTAVCRVQAPGVTPLVCGRVAWIELQRSLERRFCSCPVAIEHEGGEARSRDR